jgi:hypothetical protein
MRRLRYLITRARALAPRRVWSIASAVRPLARRPALVVFLDMIWCSLRYEVAFQDYQDWDVALLSGRERATLMTHPKSNHIAVRYNRPSHRALFADKIRFDEHFAGSIGREWLDLRTASPQSVAEFARRHPVMILKPIDSLGGHGVEKVRAEELADPSAFLARALAARQFLLEECLVQHEGMARLNPSSVNTLRLITFRRDDTVHLLAAALKIGNGGAIDNFSDGGMYAMVGDDGVAMSPAFDASGATYRAHPLTGVEIPGFAVPLFADAVDLVSRSARVVPEIPYVGWDVAITPGGPVLIEGNYNTGVFQAKPSGEGEYVGLLPRYRAAIGEF